MMKFTKVMMMVVLIAWHNNWNSTINIHWLWNVSWNADVLLLNERDMSNFLNKNRHFLLNDHLLNFASIKIGIIVGFIDLLLRSFEFFRHHRFCWNSSQCQHQQKERLVIEERKIFLRVETTDSFKPIKK